MKKYALIDAIKTGNLKLLQNVIEAPDLDEYVLDTKSQGSNFFYYLFKNSRELGKDYVLNALDIIFTNQKIIQYLKSATAHPSYENFLFLALGIEESLPCEQRGEILNKCLSINPYLYHIKNGVSAIEYTCLFEATQPLFFTFIKYGYNIHFRHSSYSALSLALEYDVEKAIEYLIEKRVSLDISVNCSKYGEDTDPFSFCLIYEKEKALSLLMNHPDFNLQMLEKPLKKVEEKIKWDFEESQLYEKIKNFYDKALEQQYLNQIIKNNPIEKEVKKQKI